MKMSSPFGIITVHGDQLASKRIDGKPILGYSLINEVAKKPSINEENSESIASPRAQAAEDTERTPLSKLAPDKCVHIGTDLTQEDRDWLIDFLHESKNIFAWSTNDLQGVSWELAQHNLNVAQGSKPRKQKVRMMSTE